MSEGLYTEPGIIQKGHYDWDDKETKIVDIYVSAESLRVYENPWVEGMAPNIPGPAEAQHQGMEHWSLHRLRFRPSILMCHFQFLCQFVCGLVA